MNIPIRIALVAVFAVVGSGVSLGQDASIAGDGTSDWLLSGGMPTEPAAQTTAVDPLEDEAEEEGASSWMLSSPFANVAWPEIKMPKIEFRAPWSSADGEPGWIAQGVERVRSATRGAAARTRTAWNNTVDRMKFAWPGTGAADQAAIAQGDTETKPGFWQRWFGADPEEESVPSIALEPETTDPTQRR